MKLLLDKIASVAKNIGLSHSVEISKNIEAREGAVIAAIVLNEKKIYKQLELVSGRMSILHKGDVIVVALGNRRALKGFVGEVPKKLVAGDVIHLLNIGGVAGTCTSANVYEVGAPLKIKVLGALVGKSDKLINIHDSRLFAPSAKLISKIPLVIISGTCMSVGKTAVASEIIKHGTHNGMKLAAAKVSGIAALKDTESMRDYGAVHAVSFIDAGYTSTVTTAAVVNKIAKGAINYLSLVKPDFIVVELGDGISGEYGVSSILSDREIQNHIIAHVGCAHDPPGALKLYEICMQLKVPLHLISGPVTDNSIGTGFIKKHLRLEAFNALTSGVHLFNYLRSKYLKKLPCTRKSRSQRSSVRF